MKQSVDDKTKELPVTAPYLVICQTKKGFREFLRKTYWDPVKYSHGNWHWTKHIGQAQEFELERLPELLKVVSTRRTASVALVQDGYFQVFGNVLYKI